MFLAELNSNLPSHEEKRQTSTDVSSEQRSGPAYEPLSSASSSSSNTNGAGSINSMLTRVQITI